MTIDTDRLQIRELVPEDWRQFKHIALDFNQSAYALYDRPFPTEDVQIRALVTQFARSQLFFAVLLGNTMIGYVCFHLNDGEYDLGYCFHSDYQGHGYALESCRAVMEHIRATQPVTRFTAGTALENGPSCKLLERLGFVLTRTEPISFQKDSQGKAITFEGGYFVKNEI